MAALLAVAETPSILDRMREVGYTSICLQAQDFELH